MQPLLQIVPRLAPARDGITDYALGLGRELESFGWRSSFLDASLTPLPNGLETSLREVSPAAVLLHYSAYGYQGRGVPLRLLSALRRITSVPLVTFFHELWSWSPPWRSPFYLNPLQRWIVTQLHRLSARSITTTSKMKRMLNVIEAGKTLWQPISSSVPEAESIPEKHFSPPWNFVIFGLSPTRSRSFEVHEKTLARWSRNCELGKVHLVGPGANDFFPGSLPQDRFEIHGSLPPDALATLLRSAHGLLSYYPGELLAKSASAMSALANGCPVLLSCAGRTEGDLVPGRHFLATAQTLSPSILGGVCQAGYEWYKTQASWAVAGRRMNECLLRTAVPARAVVGVES